MKLCALATLFALTAAQELPHVRAVHRRQAPAASSSGSTAPAATTTTPTAPQTTPLGPGTDIPALTAITSGATPEATASQTTTFAAGQSPAIHGAPPLPTPFVFQASQWPPQDKVPDTGTPQVQEWLKELDGFNIPDLAPTADGTCVGDPVAANNAANRGWWTCGGYTRQTDVVACPDKLHWGVSFDDGPSPYTQKLLNYLTAKQLHATFFVVGSRVIERPGVLLEEYMGGHEISVHTWSHRPLTSLTNAQIVAELGWTRHAIQTILGVTPVTMRPPYGDIDDRVRAISLAMGLQPIIWTRGPQGQQFDTNDWRVPGGLVNGTDSFNSFQWILGNSTLIDTGFIVLQHDLYQQTVDLAIGYTMDSALNYNPKLTLQSIGQCLGWPNTNLYLETTTNTTFPYPNSTINEAATTTNSARQTAIGSSHHSGASSSMSVSMTLQSSLVAIGFALIGGLAVL